jgi:hypothetical protein
MKQNGPAPKRKGTSGSGVPPRVLLRPHPSQWSDDELMSLPEAVALFWPKGPLTISSMRTAIRNCQLPYADIAGKFLINKSGIAALSVCRSRSQVRQSPPTVPATHSSSGALDRIRQLRETAG